jgi:hypothetical protein
LASPVGINRDGRVIEIYVRHGVGGREEVWMVEGVKQVGPEGKHLILGLPQMDWEIALKAGVKVDLSRPELRVADQISGTAVWHNEMKRIERLAWATGGGATEDA